MSEYKIKKKQDDKAQVENIVQVIEKIMQNEFVLNNEVLIEDLNAVIDRIKDTSFRMAVVGEFSSGKSTFLNAFIGKDLLKHGALETTATVTEIQNDHACGESTVLDVYYIDGNEEHNIPIERITEYTATSSSTHQVAREIEKVVIRSKLFDSEDKVCLVDTPGLNGIADNHREKTINQIKNAHACIYLMQVRGLGQSDINFLRFICKYQHNIVFIQNFIDELKELEGETAEIKIEQQKKIIDEKIMADYPDVQYQIVGISAREALIAQSNEFTEYNGEKLTIEERQNLYRLSRFQDVVDVINSLMSDNRKNRTQQKNAIATALSLFKQLDKLLSIDNEIRHKEWEQSAEGVEKRNYEELIKIMDENKDAYIRKLDNYIDSEIAIISRECKIGIADELREIEKKYNEKCNSFENLDELEKYVENIMPSSLYGDVSAVEDEQNKLLEIKLENIIFNSVLRIQEYTGIDVDKNEVREFDFEQVKSKDNALSFKEEESKLEKIESDYYQKVQQDKKAKETMLTMTKEKEKLKKEKEAKSRELNNVMMNHRIDINRLGVMPEIEKKERYETREVYRGGWGFMDAVFGPKYVTKTVTYYDDQRQKDWKYKKSQIENRYKEKEQILQLQIKTLEDKSREADEEKEKLIRNEPNRVRQIKNLEKLIIEKRESLRIKREKAAREYMIEVKQSLTNNIHTYLFNSVEDVYSENFQSVIDQNKDNLRKLIHSLFYSSLHERISSLEGILKNDSYTIVFGESDEMIKNVKESIRYLEESLCQF